LPRQLLPNLERASIPIEKLRDYVLNPDHPTGCNKARVFRAVLGMEQRHASALAEIIRDTLTRAPAKKNVESEYGNRWETQHEIIGLQGRAAIVTVAWLFKINEPDIPTLLTCYINTKNQGKLAQLFA
jgi:filamentous hemagglutinin